MRTSTASPPVTPDRRRTSALIGSRYVPSFGNSEVVNRIVPIVASTGITPQP